MQRANKALPSISTILKAVCVLITRSLRRYTQTVNKGWTDMEMRRLKNADYTRMTKIGNSANCWIQKVLVNRRTYQAYVEIFHQLF
jgi:hypothetical protein